MKSIIVPIDFSKQSERALKVAASLAKKNDAELMVLHMLELSPALMTESGYISQEQVVHLIKIGEKRFAEFLDKPYLKGVKVVPVIKHYKVFSEVNEVAEKHNADLIVMGSHGTDGLEEIFIGSNTERVVRTANVPVLVIKGDVEEFRAERFVFACDFAEESIPVVKKAAEMAKLLKSELLLVYVNTPGDEFLSTDDAYAKITKFLKEANLGLQVEIHDDYTVEKGVLNYSEKVCADLVGIPTHGRRGLSHFFMGSIGEDIANHSKAPVMTFKI